MRRKFACLSYPSGAFCVERWWTPTAAFESMGLMYVRLHLDSTSIDGQREGGGVELPSKGVDPPTVASIPQIWNQNRMQLPPILS